jgi:hypothetical protein
METNKFLKNKTTMTRYKKVNNEARIKLLDMVIISNSGPRKEISSQRSCETTRNQLLYS